MSEQRFGSGCVLFGKTTRPPSPCALALGLREAGNGPLTDQRALEFRDGTEHM
ncbi:hypothetical protein C8P69_12711 [Phreatobacter oligotrophus]|uniref:Uncharacterized protein n=1 Tax=Phreatobacter oligotrophus TaxID=1122261 RepID=A0A2T4YWC3_9HYPH|nr:hypothetical protein C8P69_12711 [Phreatobacter oligotrophus]